MKLLEEIIANKRREVEIAKAKQTAESLRESVEESTRDFANAIRNEERKFPKIIAEIKRKSPSKKNIDLELDVEEVVRIYNTHANAISVLTDGNYFGGSLEDLSLVDEVSEIPVLRKDFIIDEYQLLEARIFGADAILLIARILKEEELRSLLGEAHNLGLSALVEIHDEADLEKALTAEANIIGINNRNLETLEIDLSTTHRLAKKIPGEKIIVSESGITSREDLEELSGKVDAVLVGSYLLEGGKVEAKLESLLSQ